MFEKLYIPCILCSVAGCAIRYIQLYEKGYKIKVLYLIADLITAAFLGFMCGWFINENFEVKRSYSSLVSCLIGNIGGRVLDYFTWYIQIKFSIPTCKPHINYNWKKKEENDTEASERTEK